MFSNGSLIFSDGNGDIEVATFVEDTGHGGRPALVALFSLILLPWNSLLVSHESPLHR
jgi:hypothetical protein